MATYLSIKKDISSSRLSQEIREILHEDQSKRTIAHEAGHALVGLAKPGIFVVNYATSVPEEGMLGHVHILDRTKFKLKTKVAFENTIAALMAGRAAEKLVFGDNSYATGASADIRMAEKLAVEMALEFGMSDEFGHTIPGFKIFDGMPALKNLFLSKSDKIKTKSAVRRILEAGLKTASETIETYKDEYDALRKALEEKERLSPKEIREITGLYDPDDHYQFEGFEAFKH